MPYRCAMLGCGPRATKHAEAYRQIDPEQGQLVALCDLNEERLHAFGESFDLTNRYTDLDQMLRAEKPDVVHLVTPPTLRVELLTQLTDAGVPGVIVEKPVCLGAADYHALRRLEARTATKIVVNHQLRHHRMILEFLDEVNAGQLGEVRFLDATCLLPMSGQGVHVLDLMFAFNSYSPVATVFGASSGYDDIDGRHPSPAAAESLLTFENGARGALMAGQGAPVFQEGPRYMQKRISVCGTHGFRQWRMNGYERSQPNGQLESGELDYATEDEPGQARLTQALFDWLGDDARKHPNNLGVSLDQWLVILAGYASTLEARAIDLPFDPPEDLLEQYQRRVGVA